MTTNPQDDPQPDEREALVVVEPDSWPCDLRVTHDPHVAEWVQRAHEGSAFATTERGSYDCPGARREWPTSVVNLAWMMSVARYGHTDEHMARLLANNPAWVPYDSRDLVAADAVLAAGFRRDPDTGLPS